jgi:RNA polymerase sigma factor (TIGR02999 family)
VRELSSSCVTELLVRWKNGDEQALNDLLRIVYPDLRRLANQHLRRERPDHTLQSTALVHEAYLRLEKQGVVKFENRSHFLAICSQLMRQILVEYARGRRTAKRDGGVKLALDDIVVAARNRGADLVALDDALNQLAKLDAQQARIVELRFFGGLSIEETADVVGVSPATVKRDWAAARIWLHRELKRTDRDDA